jgi:hypothetical protein
MIRNCKNLKINSLFVLKKLAFIVLCFYISDLNAQSIDKVNVFLKKGSTILLGKKRITALNDTIVIVPKSTSFKIRNVIDKKSEVFYDSLKTKAARNKFTNELYNIFITRKQTDIERLNIKTIKAESEFTNYKGKTIRSIKIKRLEPFGTSVFDTSITAESWIEKSVNALHLITLENVVKSNLIIKEGDVLNSYILAENERILRNLPYIYDARIYASNIDGDYVDVIIITRDLWSIGILPDLGKSSGNIEVYDLNYLGLGNSLRAELLYNKDSMPNLGYRFQYDFSNIKRTFIDASLIYQNVFMREKFGVVANRNFVSSKSKYAGGGLLMKNNDLAYLKSFSNSDSITNINYLNSEIWLGSSFVLSKKTQNINSLRLIVSAGYFNKHFYKRLFVDQNTNKLFHQSSLILGSISLSKRNYYKGNLIYAFGTVEDIPYGYLIETTFGAEQREFGNRIYGGLQLSAGNFIRNSSYLYAMFGIGGYKNGNHIEQSVLKFNINSFSTLYYHKRYKFRNFFKLSYIVGINRFEGESIKTDFEEILMKSNEITGTQKLSFKIENVAFTPIDFYGFKVAFYGFWDVGIIGSNKHFILNEKYFLGIGGGFRIRNDNLVFQTFQINISYYPLLPSGGSSGLVFGISGQNVLKLFDFVASKPREVVFR